MLTTTIYDQSNATITGTYHTYKGEQITVEFMGTALECECYMNGVYQADDGGNEVQHVVIFISNRRPLVGNKWNNDTHTYFALHHVWADVASIPVDFETEYRSIHQ